MAENAIRWDSLLARHVARELNDRFAGRRVHALHFDRERLIVRMRCGDATLIWALAPDRGDLQIVASRERLRGNVPLPRPAVAGDVSAASDERMLTIRLEAEHPTEHDVQAGAARELLIELIPPAWNAVAIGADRQIIGVLRPRQRGARPLEAGRVYEPPRPTARAGATTAVSTDEWRQILGSVPPSERSKALLARVAYTSPINRSHILGSAARSDDDRALDDALVRYRALTIDDATSPCVIEMADGAQPYPFPLDGMASEPQPTLLDAFNAAARVIRRVPADTTETAATAIALEHVRRQQHRLNGRIARLRDELEGAPADAPALRRQADLLLAQLGNARRGDQSVTLDDFAGGTIVVPLDPTLSPADNAQRLYDTARKRERAAQRLPLLLRNAESEAANLNELAARIQAGTASTAELQSLAPAPERRRHAIEPRLPYRRYRTSSGLEVRVGRSARDSDELTLHQSSPNDIWLHAREVAGAHVVLRWTDRDANPPGPDLRQAAILAAIHSKARGSATVPVDWTRRKYVRKPRKAPPGRVAIERAKTLFVEPSESLERRLRESRD